MADGKHNLAIMIMLDIIGFYLIIKTTLEALSLVYVVIVIEGRNVVMVPIEAVMFVLVAMGL